MTEQTLTPEQIKEIPHEEVRNICDAMSAKLQQEGLPVVVIPLRTLLLMEQTLNQTKLPPIFMEPTPESGPSLIEQDWGIDIGMAGGSPRPEHAHLCRDTAQDILNAKARERNRNR